jgi:cellulose synthase/poly-beta-1,6-N-acetylglucosamine synthase-like glycosyltransferase
MNGKVSVIIPFVEFNTYLAECVSHCLKLDYPDFNIILLPDNEIALPDEFVNEKIMVVQTGDCNIASKRNVGISNSSGDFYAFIDSDAYPERDWLKNAVRAFSGSKDIWAVGGPNITPPGEDTYRRCVGNALKSFFVSGANAFRKKRAASRYCSDLPSCNLIVNKEAMDALKGFNENLFTGEDVELCKRIISNGKKIFFDSGVVVFHHNRSLFKPFFLQRVTYGSTVFTSFNEEIFRKHISFQTISFFLPMFFILFIVTMGIASVFSKLLFVIFSFILLSYVTIFIVEAFRQSEAIREVPLTFLSLLIGNLAPGMGSLTALFGIKTDLKAIYTNYDTSGKAVRRQ